MFIMVRIIFIIIDNKLCVSKTMRDTVIYVYKLKNEVKKSTNDLLKQYSLWCNQIDTIYALNGK